MRQPVFTAERETHSWQLAWRHRRRQPRYPHDDVVSERIVIGANTAANLARRMVVLPQAELGAASMVMGRC